MPRATPKFSKLGPRWPLLREMQEKRYRATTATKIRQETGPPGPARTDRHNTHQVWRIRSNCQKHPTRIPAHTGTHTVPCPSCVRAANGYSRTRTATHALALAKIMVNHPQRWVSQIIQPMFLRTALTSGAGKCAPCRPSSSCSQRCTPPCSLRPTSRR